MSEQHQHHSYSTDYLIACAKRLLINYPKYMQMDGGPDANGLNFMLDMYCDLGGLDGARWRQVRHFIAENHPGLLDRTPSPDNVLRRGRDVKKECRDNGLLQPVLTPLEQEMLKAGLVVRTTLQ